MKNTLNEKIVKEFLSTYHGGTFLRVGSMSEKNLTKEMKGFKVVKVYELNGRIGCRYSAVAKLAPEENSVKTDKASNYEWEIKGRIKRFFSTGSRQLMFYPCKNNKTARPKSSFYLVSPNGEWTEISRADAEGYGMSANPPSVILNVNVNNIWKLNDFVAD